MSSSVDSSPHSSDSTLREIEAVQLKFDVLNYSPVGFCLIRHDYLVLFWNRCLEQWTHHSVQAMVGSDLRSNFPCFSQPRYHIRLKQVFGAGFPAIFSPQLHKPLFPSAYTDDPLRIQQTTVTAVPALHGTGFYALLVIQDVTELTQQIQIYQQELKERKRTEVELQRSNSELEQFAYVASHDMREPLRMVTSFTQLLADQYSAQLDENANQMINFAVDGARRMEALISDLLTFSRVGTKGGEFQSIDCAIALNAALSNLQMMVKESQAVITHDSLPTVMADPRQLIQLFQNLLNNAIKYRSNTPPKIHIAVQKEEHHWQFSVEDNGIGIDAKYSDRIFMLFQRLHTRSTYPGTGIGLALCKKIVQRHRGHIWLKPDVTQGTTFCFTLPLT